MERPSDIDIVPQTGFQRRFLSSRADIVIGGGSAGCGKTWALLVAPLVWIAPRDGSKHLYDHSKFSAALFRRTYPEITMDGGMWDESKEIYYGHGGVPLEHALMWRFPSGARVSFEHVSENELNKYQGAQFNLIGLDEVTHYSKKTFFYLLTRNRSKSGIRPTVKATCNPDPDSWLADFIGWWIDQETGYPIPERDGVLRYVVIDQDQYVWGMSWQEVYEKARHIFDNVSKLGIHPRDLIKSVTFVAGNIRQNHVLLQKNPQYLANLLSQDEVIKEQLLNGNWKVRTDNLSLFNWMMIECIFSNIIQEKHDDQFYIVIDHARFGRDLCVIGTWKGWKCIRIDVLTKSDTNAIVKIITQRRFEIKAIPVVNVMVDQDGIGVADSLGCRVFQGARPATPTRIPGTSAKIDTEFKNKKTQCYFKAADQVNAGQMFIDMFNVWVDGSRIDKVKLGGETHEIKRLIKEDLRVIKREKPDAEGKKQITNKEQHKNALGGRSPDFGDMIMMRCEFEFVKAPRYVMA